MRQIDVNCTIDDYERKNLVNCTIDDHKDLCVDHDDEINKQNKGKHKNPHHPA